MTRRPDDPIEISRFNRDCLFLPRLPMPLSPLPLELLALVAMPSATTSASWWCPPVRRWWAAGWMTPCCSTDAGERRGASDHQDALVEVLIPAGSRLIGQSRREVRFLQKFTSTVLAIRRGEDLLLMAEPDAGADRSPSRPWAVGLMALLRLTLWRSDLRVVWALLLALLTPGPAPDLAFQTT
jgi:hypothetical protein